MAQGGDRGPIVQAILARVAERSASWPTALPAVPPADDEEYVGEEYAALDELLRDAEGRDEDPDGCVVYSPASERTRLLQPGQIDKRKRAGLPVLARAGRVRPREEGYSPKPSLPSPSASVRCCGEASRPAQWRGEASQTSPWDWEG